MKKHFILGFVLLLFQLQGQTDSITPEIIEVDFSDTHLEYYNWPDMRMEYDTIETQTYDFVIGTISFQFPAAKIIVREYTEAGKIGDSVVWNLTSSDTGVVHDWTGVPKVESVWVPFEAGFYKLDTLWDPSTPNRWHAVDTALGRDVYADFFLQGSKNEIFQANRWFEHFVKTYPSYSFNMTYFNGKDWVKIATQKEVKTLEDEFLTGQQEDRAWFEIYLSSYQNSSLDPDIQIIIKVKN